MFDHNLEGKAASPRNLILLDENVGGRRGSANALGVRLDSGIHGADCGSDLATLVENSVDDGEVLLDDFLAFSVCNFGISFGGKRAHDDKCQMILDSLGA